MRIPEQVLPLLRKVSSSRSVPLEFWQSDDGARIMECFSELAAELTLSHVDLLALPKGYRLAALLFQWENECQAESWNAFAWTSDIATVVQAYRDVGLSEEGEAISRAAAAWSQSPGDYDAAGAAYDQQEHGYRVDLDRLEYLVDYFCERAGMMFYEHDAA